MEQTAPAPRWLKPSEFAERTGLPQRSVYELVRIGEIKGAVKLGARLYIPVTELTELFDRGRIAA